MSGYNLDFRSCDAKQCVCCVNSEKREVNKETGFYDRQGKIRSSVRSDDERSRSADHREHE